MSGSDQALFTPSASTLASDELFNRQLFQLASDTTTGFGAAILASLFFKRKGAAITFFTGSAFGYSIYEANQFLIRYKALHKSV
jgi:hypothetical protein